MLISSAILSRTVAVGVGFLLNSTSSVVNWSCVALCLFWFFCCCVRVLLRGGRLEAEFGPFEVDVEGEGVWLPLAAEFGVGRPAWLLAGEADEPGAGGTRPSSCLMLSVAISGPMCFVCRLSCQRRAFYPSIISHWILRVDQVQLKPRIDPWQRVDRIGVANVWFASMSRLASRCRVLEPVAFE